MSERKLRRYTPGPRHCLVLGLLLANLCWAAEFLEEISVTALRAPGARSDLTGSFSTLDAAQLEFAGATHIQQVLAGLPGVNLHHNSGQEYLPAIRSPVLSGAGACGSFLMAEDGIPLRPAGFCNVNELFEAHSEQANRIEVIRGPGSVLYGSNALHGVVNVITAPPAGAGAASGTTLALDYSTESFSRLRLRGERNNVALAFTGTHDNGFRDRSGVDQQKLSLWYRRSGEDLSVISGLTLVNLNQETAGFIEGTDSYRDWRQVKANPNPEAYRDARALRLWSRIEDDPVNPGWAVTAYGRWSEMAFLQHFLPGTPLEENGQHSVGLQSARYLTVGASRLIVGLDAELVHGWLQESQVEPVAGTELLRETIPVGDHYDYLVEALQLAPFVRWGWRTGERWRLNLGLRYEWMHYDYDNRMADGRTRDDGSECGFGGCRFSRPPDGTDSFRNLSPSAGISYDLGVGQQVYLSLARGFRAPQAVELYRLQREQRVADLDSERLDSVEIGVRGAGQRYRYELVAYLMQKQNLIFRDSDLFNVDSGRTRHQGLELALDYALSGSLSLRVAATEARHRYDYHEQLSGIDINGNDIDTAPHRFGSLTLSWQPENDWQVELEWRHMGSYYTDPENLHAYGGYDQFYLRSRWQVSPDLALSGRISNLLDKPYAERADYTGFSGDRYMPGEPITLFLGFEYRWR